MGAPRDATRHFLPPSPSRTHPPTPRRMHTEPLLCPLLPVRGRARLSCPERNKNKMRGGGAKKRCRLLLAFTPPALFSFRRESASRRPLGPSIRHPAPPRPAPPRPSGPFLGADAALTMPGVSSPCVFCIRCTSERVGGGRVQPNPVRAEVVGVGMRAGSASLNRFDGRGE